MAKGFTISSVIPEKTIQLIYNTAKIIANPYDYKILDRAMCYSTKVVGDVFNIFEKTSNTEVHLNELLKLSFDNYMNYMKLNPKLRFGDYVPKASWGFIEICKKLDYLVGTSGALVKYNNLRIDEETLSNDLAYLYKTKDPFTNKALALSFQYQDYLKALEVLLTKATNADSLIPNLMYLTTEYADYRLVDLEDITFAVNTLEHGDAVLCANREYADEDDDIACKELLCTINVPFYYKDVDAPKTYEDCEDMLLFKGDHLESFGNAVYKLGICYSVLYGAELLYHMSNIDNPDVVTALEKLFAINYRNGSFCSKYLYEIESDGHLEVNPRIKACFCEDPNLRFESFKLLFDSYLTMPDFHDEVLKNYDYYVIPVFFARMIMSMHNYAFQVCRIKHATLLYTRAKDAGVLTKEAMSSLKRITDEDGFDDEMVMSGTGEPDNELMNLDHMEFDGEDKRPFEEKEKDILDRTSDTPPMLNAMDRLKKDLSESMYDFDIDYVKHENSCQASYNAIANAIQLITHDLSRQIKDIKTYNSGGKQGGLTAGKLDKKNLWKYRQDPHIFCNNNYKLKEMDLAFGCILDESGSMCGEKVKNGRIVMIMLHEVLSSLGINHSIIGHTSRCDHHSKIFKYYQFKEEAHYTLNKPYGLVKADARSGNCDSGALFYMESTMKAVRNKDKIVIIFSDGQPTECTEGELVDQVRHMERNGIHVIGVGINFPSIKEYYPDNANGKNLKEMVAIVVSILKRYVLEKKED